VELQALFSALTIPLTHRERETLAHGGPALIFPVWVSGARWRWLTTWLVEPFPFVGRG
jgi:hypothetical protein